MERSTKVILISLGVLAVGGVATFFILRNRKNKKAKSNTNSGTAVDSSKGTPLKMGYLSKGYIHIEGDDRKVALSKGLKKGSKISIEGTDFDGDYTISTIWKDKNGNVGAFKTEEFSIGYNDATDRKYQKKAIIYIK